MRLRETIDRLRRLWLDGERMVARWESVGRLEAAEGGREILTLFWKTFEESP